MRKTIFSLKAVLCTMALCFAGILQANALENTVATAYTATEALEVIANGEGLDAKVYVKGKISKINEVSPKYGNATFYITDGASELYIYRTYGLNGAKFTSEDDLAVGDNVVLYGQLVNYKGNTPEMTTGGQIVSISGAGKFSEPLFTWTPGKKAQGGYIAYVNSKSNDNLTNSYLCLNGKAENLNDGVASKDAGHALITFDRVLCKSDVLTFTGYADGVSASLYLVFSTGAVVADSQSFFSTDGTISIAVPEAAVGAASVIITRNDANSDLYLTSISCVHNSYAVKSAWLGDVAKDGAIVKLFNPATANFLNQGNAWGTQASRDAAGLRFNLSEESEGIYKIVTCNYPDRQLGWDNGSGFYVDITNQAETRYQFVPVETADAAQNAFLVWVESKVSGNVALTGYLTTSEENTVVDVKAEADEYCIWQIQDETKKVSLENKFAALKAGAYKPMALQTSDETAAGYLWSNAPDQQEGLHPEYMLDGDVNTFFHSDWHGVVNDPHYLEVDMGEGQSISEFSLSYTRRMNNNNNRATEIIIEGSNDGENFTAIRTLTEAEDGLPTVAGNDSYTSPMISCGAAYRYIRFTISKVNNGTIFFTFSEFGLGVKGNRFGIVTSAVAAAQAVLDDENATIADIAAAKAALAEALESKIADGTYYLINNASGKFLSRGAGWGTQACLADFGLPFNVSTDAEGIIRLSSIDMPDQRLSYVDGTFNGSYVDGDGRDSNFRVLATDNGYIFKNDAAGYLGIEPDAATKAWYGVGAHASEAEALTFELLSADEYEAIIAANFKAGKDAAAAAAGIDDADYAISNWYAIDATSNVKSAALVGGYDGWTWKNFGDLGLNRGGGLASNENGTECYEGSGILSQVVEGLTPGFYKVTLNGFYRTNWERTVNVDWCENGWFVSTAYLQANGNKVRIKPVGEEASINEAGDNIYPNWMNESKDCFDRGLYLNEVYACVGADGKLEVSINIPSWASQCWLMFNNLKLYRYSSEPEAIDGDATGIQAVAAEAGTSTIFNANGAQVAEPVKGVNIVKTVMSDGSVKVEKIFVK